MTKRVRPSKDEYFMNIAAAVASRATCLRRQVGAVLVKNDVILSTGYNGAPSGVNHCETCMREEAGIPSGQRHELCWAAHAEANAIAQAARRGTAIDNATLYCTTQPCSQCAKMIINAGIVKVVYNGTYPDDMAIEMFRQARVRVLPYHEMPKGVDHVE